jgi:hypothetical protein
MSAPCHVNGKEKVLQIKSVAYSAARSGHRVKLFARSWAPEDEKPQMIRRRRNNR